MSTGEIKTLLIDAGNSSLKWALFREGRLESGEPVIYQSSSRTSSPGSLLVAQLSVAWKALGESANRPDRIIVSNVAGPWVMDAIHQWAGKHMEQELPVKDENGLTIDNVVARGNASDVTNAYQQPGQLGSDRWAGLIAARHLVEGDCCIIGCGTALTIDIIDASGVHQGGTISPGWQMMKNSLVQGTDAIHDELISEEFSAPELLGKNTREAIEAGVAAACAGAVKHVIDRYQETTGLTLRCVITGGCAGQLLSQLQQVNPGYNFQHEPDWVLKGLVIISGNIVINEKINDSGNMK